MRSAFAIAVVVLALVWPVASPAQSLDPASAEALAATLRLLQDPSARAVAGRSFPARYLPERKPLATASDSPPEFPGTQRE